MKHTEERTLVYFHNPSSAARRMLFYPLVGGIFKKNNGYRIHRLRFDSVMLACISEGALHLNQAGEHFCARKGEVLLVDCYREHEYYTDTYVQFSWIHIDGATVRPWLDEMKQRHGQALKISPKCSELLLSVIGGIQEGEGEYLLSQKIHGLLCEIASFGEEANGGEASSAVNSAKEYMRNHLEEKLTVQQIAAHCNYSPSYFSALFRQEAKTSPYEYLLSCRIERAKNLLLQTKYPLDLVAQQSGFGSVPHFICSFKQATGLSPLKFRKLKF